MDIPVPFIPPVPVRRNRPLGRWELLRIAYKNPLELWGEPFYSQPVIELRWQSVSLVVINDPKFIRHVLIDNVANYPMSSMRQRVLRPILRDGLLTAEGALWMRSRKAVAPMFTPRNVSSFAIMMRNQTINFAQRYVTNGSITDIAHDMTLLTYDILVQTLFSGEIIGDSRQFARQIETLLNTMGRVDPFDLLDLPDWIPRITHIRGMRSLSFFRSVVNNTITARKTRCDKGEIVPNDFLTLLLGAEKPGGLTHSEIEDNIITFIGAGHETTARALAWTLFLLSKAPRERECVETEIDEFFATGGRDLAPQHWLSSLPITRAAFEESMRLYPPAPSINREAADDDWFGGVKVTKGATILIMPWVLHRHKLFWEQPDAFVPERFWPQNRNKIDRFQYLPFGAGPRVCVGTSFAMQEAVIALAILLDGRRFEALETTQPWPVQKLTTQPQGGLPMKYVGR